MNFGSKFKEYKRVETTFESDDDYDEERINAPDKDNQAP